MVRRTLLVTAAMFGFLGVAALAFGAHVLEGQGDERALRLVRTAANQQMWHALAMLVCGAFASVGPWPTAFFGGGILLFSGSLYALALGAPTAIAVITPIGGTMLLAGWLVLAWSLLRSEP